MSLTGNDLKSIGFLEGKTIGMALALMEKEFAHLTNEQQLELLREVIKSPSAFENNDKFLPLVQTLLMPADPTIPLNTSSLPYQIYGAEAIEQGALSQMETAMKLPVTVAGALMPDAHQGYGLPIGGVLATKNAVIP